LHDPNAKVQVIPTNFEKFLAVQIDSIRFLDSFQFLSSYLDKLVSTMARDNTDEFVHTKRHFGSDDPNIFKKGVYPSEYVTGPEILAETCFPPSDKFYSELNEEGISEEDYDHALETWQRHGCKTMRDYHDHYLTLDDFFENFRVMAFREYKLDPTHSWTVPGFAWNCALKISKAELKLITDPETFFILRKCNSRHSHRHSPSPTINHRHSPSLTPSPTVTHRHPPSITVTHRHLHRHLPSLTVTHTVTHRHPSSPTVIHRVILLPA